MMRWIGLANRNVHPDDVRMTLGEHLEELRSRLVRAIVALAVGAVICYAFIDYVIGFLVGPMFAVLRSRGIEPRMVALAPAENFITYLKVAVIVGFMLSAPYSLAQIWGFVAAGLYPHERRWVRKFLPASIILFFTGVSFLLLVAFPLLLDFLVTYGTRIPDLDMVPAWLLPEQESIKTSAKPPESEFIWPSTQPMAAFEQDPADAPERVPWINLKDHAIRIRIGEKPYTIAHLKLKEDANRLEPMMRISEYILFALHLAAAFGIGFQVPVIVAFIAVLGIAPASQMASMRKYVWFGMSICAAIITPPDVSSMLMLLVPMALLYEVGLFVARLIERRRAAEGNKNA